MNLTQSIALVATTLLLGFNVSASANSDLTSVFKGNNTPRSFSGVAAVAKDGQVVFQHASEGFDADTRFVIGSLSKQITAAMVLIKAQKQRLHLDKPISRYIPNLPPEWADRVTIRHLLNHTSGIVALDKPLKSPPGSQFAYSNLGYDLLGEIITSQPAKNYLGLAKLVFKYCDMSKSKAYGQFGLVDGFVELKDGKLTKVNKRLKEESIPSGGIISTVNDLIKWNQCLHGGKLFKNDQYQQMVTNAATRKHRWGDLGYGFGLQLGKNGGQTEYSHSGYVPGYIATMTYHPETKTTMVLLENTSWHTEDMSRVFYYHDKLRQALVK